MIYIFDWLGDLIQGVGDAIGGAFGWVGNQVSSAIWEAMLQWYYETIYNAIADFFTLMGNMGAELFSLSWVQATVNLFVLFGWSLFAAGLVVAIFDVAIEYQCGRANIKTTALNILKGFFACSMIGVVPIELYKFCITLQNSLAHDIAVITAAERVDDFGSTCSALLSSCFGKGMFGFGTLFTILSSCQDFLCQHQAWWYSADTNGGGFAVYVQRSERLHGRLQPVDEASGGFVFDSIYADDIALSRLTDFSDKYASWLGCHVSRQRGSEDSTAVRS